MSSDPSAQPVPQVAVIGCGYWGKNLIRNFYQLGSLVGIFDEFTQVAEGYKEQYPDIEVYSSFQSILDDSRLQAVVIAAPALAHYELVRQALHAGKDVFVEKPLALSSEEGAQLVQLAEEKNRILMVGHLLWYHSAVLKLKELIQSGELGKIRYIYSNRLNFGKIRREENILWSFAPHDISVILGLLGEVPETIEANGGNYLQPQVADVTVSLLSFPSGVKAHIFVSWLHPFKEQKLVVVGEKKMAVFDDVEPENKLMLYSHSVDWQNHVPIANKADGEVVSFETSEPLKNECQHFLDCVVDRATPRTDGKEGLRVLQVLQTCQEALSTSEAVTLDQGAPQKSRDYFAHESAFIDDEVEIGAGTKIWHVSHVLTGSKVGANCNIGQNVVIGPRAVVGNGCKIQNNVSVYERVILEDGVFCGPSMVFTNVINPRSEIVRKHEYLETRVKKGATLGANCTIVCGVSIGKYAFIGAGAVVTKDVPDYALVVGNPAVIKGYMCECGLKLTWQEEDSQEIGTCACGKRYLRENDEVRLAEEMSLS